MQSFSENPFKSQICEIGINISIIWNGKNTIPGDGVEAEIVRIIPNGIFLKGNVFFPFSKIDYIVPLRPVEAAQGDQEEAHPAIERLKEIIAKLDVLDALKAANGPHGVLPGWYDEKDALMEELRDIVKDALEA